VASPKNFNSSITESKDTEADEMLDKEFKCPISEMTHDFKENIYEQLNDVRKTM
jgi:hypothetical protein